MTHAPTPAVVPSCGKRAVVAGLAAVLVLGACTTLDPYTREEKTSHAAKGAAIGAATGAIAGVIIGDSRKALLIGAGIGALTGAAVGNYMDQQEAELRRKLEGTGVRVVRTGDQITLVMPGNITFATDSADVTSNFYPVLNSVALVVDKYEQTYVDVIGHTDSTGRREYNQQLSVRRAQSVADYLLAQDVTPERIVVSGRGQDYPIAANDTAEGRQLNRRVEIVLTPLT
jgi:outer membrane protein OmpA-like peptidoglycan-associated protein